MKKRKDRILRRRSMYDENGWLKPYPKGSLGAVSAELEDYKSHLAQSTTKLKQMCDLCDRQRAEIRTANIEVTRLKAILMAAKILIRSVEAAN